MYKAYFVTWLKMKNRKTELHLSKVSISWQCNEIPPVFQLADHVKHRIFVWHPTPWLHTWLSNLWSVHTWRGQGKGVNLIRWEPYIGIKNTKGKCPISALWPLLCVTMSISISKGEEANSNCYIWMNRKQLFHSKSKGCCRCWHWSRQETSLITLPSLELSSCSCSPWQCL